MITVEYLDSALTKLRAMKKKSEADMLRCEGAIEALEGLKVYLARNALPAGESRLDRLDALRYQAEMMCLEAEVVQQGQYLGLLR